jgi:hypothetical protein
MSWATDLASALGIPAGAAMFAVGMYGACAAAESVARPGALVGISRNLKDSSWERSLRPSAIIAKIFNWTFGERHLSWRCLGKSAAATSLFCVSLAVMYHITLRQPLEFYFASYSGSGRIDVASGGSLVARVAIGILLFAAIPDYVALAKTRLLVRAISSSRGIARIVLLVVADVGLSAIISFVFAFGMFFVTRWTYRYWHWAWPPLLQILHWGYLASEDDYLAFDTRLNFFATAKSIFTGILAPFNGRLQFGFVALVFLSSTLLTSIWTILIVLSTTVLKLLTPLQRFTAWFFDLEKHPLQAIGIVAGAVVMCVSLVWTVVRAMI